MIETTRPLFAAAEADVDGAPDAADHPAAAVDQRVRGRTRSDRHDAGGARAGARGRAQLQVPTSAPNEGPRGCRVRPMRG